MMNILTVVDVCPCPCMRTVVYRYIVYDLDTRPSAPATKHRTSASFAIKCVSGVNHSSSQYVYGYFIFWYVRKMKLYMYYIYHCTFDIFLAHWKLNWYVTYKLSTFVLCISISKICWNIRYAKGQVLCHLYVEVWKPMLQTFQYHVKCMLCSNNPPFTPSTKSRFMLLKLICLCFNHSLYNGWAYICGCQGSISS